MAPLPNRIDPQTPLRPVDLIDWNNSTMSDSSDVEIVDVDDPDVESNGAAQLTTAINDTTHVKNNAAGGVPAQRKLAPMASSVSTVSSNLIPIPGKDLVWSNVSMKLMDSRKNGVNGEPKVKLQILNQVWGKAEKGKTTAIMGASGAGKTSLFQTLAGRVSSQGNLQLEGDIYLGGIKVDPHDQDHRKLFAYVSQEDSLHETSTPREALFFSAKLRLPRTTSNDEIEKLVTAMINELGLSSAADTIVGGGLKKGISGGEKRRVSIGVELVASPSILFLDEPTSGLDSYAAHQVMSLLHRVSRAGTTVLFTIHQPSSNIFGTFDRLILLHKGRVMHQGAVSKVAHDFDVKYHQPVPTNYNPADWLVDVAQTHSLEDLEHEYHFFPPEPVGHKPTTPMVKDGMGGTTMAVLEIPDLNHVSVWQEFRLLQQREMRSLHRNPTPMIINVTLTSILAVIFGVIFLDVGRQDRSEFSVVQSQLGAIVNLLISTLMGQSNTAIFVFSSERPVFLREYSTNHYTIIPYFLSKLWSEALNSFAAILCQTLITYWLMGFQMTFGQLLVLTYSLALTATAVAVMLGAFFANPKNATGLYTLVVVPQFYFSGLFIAIELIPEWVSWAQYLCSMTYASRLGFAYEFGNCNSSDLANANCEAVLAANNVQKDGVWWYWLALMGLFTTFRLGGIYVLRSKARY